MTNIVHTFGDLIIVMFTIGSFRMQCFGHRLNLAIRKALKETNTKEALLSMKKVIRHFKSHKQRTALKKAQVRLLWKMQTAYSIHSF